MNVILDLTYNFTSTIFDSASAVETISTVAQTAISLNPYLLLGAAAVGAGTVLYNRMVQRQLDTNPVQPKKKLNRSKQATAVQTVKKPKTVKYQDTYNGEFLNGKWHGQGVLVCANTDRYEGEFKDGKLDGHGKFITDEGKYQGQFKNDLYHGIGFFQFADGSKYKGEFREGEMHGFGVYDSDEISYEGEFEHDQFNGCGILHSIDGTCYRGRFLNDESHGPGELTYADGKTVYKGTFVNGKREGTGIITFSANDYFIGHFADDKKNGPSYEVSENGNLILYGTYQNDRKEGEFYEIRKNPEISQTFHYNNNYVVHTKKENIKDPLFFYQLFDIPSGGATPGYSLGILADYLESKYKDDPEIQESLVAPLKQMVAFCETPAIEMDQKRREIVTGLYAGQSYLLPYGCSGHAMLLNLVPSPDGEYVDCEIYNSGDGLEYHTKDKSTGKLQLMKAYRVPIKMINTSILQELLNNDEYFTSYRAYTTLSDIEGTQELASKRPVWKRPQKVDNCQTKCFNAFKDEKIPKKAKAIQKDLFQDTLDAARANKDVFGEQDVITLPQVKHKIEKLKLSIH